MRFHIGPEVYRVRITEEPIYHDGEEALGQCLYASREILISPAVAPEHRFTTLLHELRHAWQFHVPKPRTPEEEADLSAMVMKAFWRDFTAQGGERALKRMLCVPDVVADAEDVPAFEPPPLEGERFVPIDQVEDWQCPAPSAAGRAQCGRCELVVADGSIVTGKARWHFIAKGWVVDRTLFCPHCNHLQRWVEGANLDGVPNGAPVDEPEYVRGADVERFLSDHPRAVGMIAS